MIAMPSSILDLGALGVLAVDAHKRMKILHMQHRCSCYTNEALVIGCLLKPTRQTNNFSRKYDTRCQRRSYKIVCVLPPKKHDRNKSFRSRGQRLETNDLSSRKESR
jgi:hypothetical protein